MAVRVPDETKRTVILGRTGAGKTQFAMDLFSTQNWHEQPWVIIDYKGDCLVIELQRRFKNQIKEIKVTDRPPTKPGIYVLRPLPGIDDEAMEQFLMLCWSQQDIGIYLDEGYMVSPNSNALKAILTQGRSRRVPIIALYQRPVYMSRFAVAQADFFAVFDQNDKRDLKTTSEFIKDAVLVDGRVITVYSKLPKYHCLWYDVGEGETAVLKPARSEAEIMAAFARRLKPTRKTGLFI